MISTRPGDSGPRPVAAATCCCFPPQAWVDTTSDPMDASPFLSAPQPLEILTCLGRCYPDSHAGCTGLVQDGDAHGWSHVKENDKFSWTTGCGRDKPLTGGGPAPQSNLIYSCAGARHTAKAVQTSSFGLMGPFEGGPLSGQDITVARNCLF